jgi:hypothetical protein
MIAESEFKEWLDHPVTREMMKLIEAKTEALKTEWMNGNYTAATRDETLIRNVSNLGMAQALRQIRELEYENFLEIDDGK